MAGLTPTVTTSSFKPLSLDEIMAVPLAKQAQEDQAQLALDEFSALESQSLDADKEYVSGQIGAFKKEAGSLSDQLMTQGVDRNLINKVRDLRNRKRNELSLEGKSGQAAAAYNQFQANSKAIMARKDLTAEQKKLGLERAKSNYTGVAEGGQYEDYVGTAHVDLMEKGREIVKQMTPEQKAGALGMTVDENGLYRDGTYSYERLKPEQIQRVIYQALKNDTNVNAYITELADLGIADPEKMLQDAAISAGNVGQVSRESEKFNLMPQYLQQAGRVDDTKGIIDTSQPWSKQTLASGEAAYNKTFNVDADFGKEVGFEQEVFDANGNLVSGGNLILTVEDAEKTASRAAALENAKKLAKEMPYKDAQMMMIAANQMYGQTAEDERIKRATSLKEELSKLRTENPEAFNGKNDKYVYDTYVKGRTKASKNYSEVIKPINPKNTFYTYGENILGTEDRAGDFMTTRGIKIMGETGVGAELNGAAIAKKLGYTPQEFAAVVGKNGSLLGLSPADPDFPMGPVVQIPAKDEDGGFITLVMSPDRNISEAYPDPKRMTANLVSGKSYDVGIGTHLDKMGNPAQFYKHYVNRINPDTGEYESKIVRSKRKFTEEELRNLQFGQNKTAFLNGETIENTDTISYEEVVNQSINGITRMFDTAPTGSTSVKQGMDANQ